MPEPTPTLAEAVNVLGSHVAAAAVASVSRPAQSRVHQALATELRAKIENLSASLADWADDHADEKLRGTDRELLDAMIELGIR